MQLHLSEMSTVTNNPSKSYIDVRYLNQTNNHIVMAVGGEESGGNSTQRLTKEKGHNSI